MSSWIRETHEDLKKADGVSTAQNRIDLAISDLVRALGEIATASDTTPGQKIEGAKKALVVIGDLKEARRDMLNLIAHLRQRPEEQGD